MVSQLLALLNPFLTVGISTFVLYYYFVKPKHKLRKEQLLLFWFLVSAVFFFIPYIPKTITIPFAYFLIQTVVAYLLLRNYWRVTDKETVKLTAIFLVSNVFSIVISSYLFNGVV